MSNHGDDWKREVKEDQDYICLYCGKKGNAQSMNIHHKQPKSRGGDNSRDNVVAWHIVCHKRYHREHGCMTSDNFGNPIREDRRIKKKKKKKHRKY